MPAYRYTRVDVFTDNPLSGNPLIVFTNGAGLDTKTMQAVAREMNLSEAVFVLPAEKGGTAKIRIFTPKVELPFAGHPVLGTAFVLAAPLQMNVSARARITDPIGQPREPDLPPRWPWTAPLFSRGH